MHTLKYNLHARASHDHAWMVVKGKLTEECTRTFLEQKVRLCK